MMMGAEYDAGSSKAARTLRAGKFVQRDQAGALFPADLDDDHVPLDERRRRDTPDRHTDLVFAEKVLGPQDFAGGRVEAVKVPHGPQCVGPAAIEGDRSPWAGEKLYAAV